MRRGPVELVQEPASHRLERGRHLPVGEGPVDVGDLPIRLVDDADDVARHADLQRRRQVGVEHDRGAGLQRLVALGSRSAWKIGARTTGRARRRRGGRRSSSRRGSPAASGPRARRRVSAVTREPEAEADQHLRRHRPPRRGARQEPERREAARDEQRPPAACATGRAEPPIRGAANAADRHRRHDHGGRQRLDPPALDEQQHEQEQRGRERRRQQRQRAVPARAAGPAAALGAPARRVWPQREQRRAARPAPAARKIHSQPASCVSAPPTAGPTAAPATPAAAHDARRPRRRRAAPAARARRRPGAAPPTAWMQRARQQHVERSGQAAHRRGDAEHRDADRGAARGCRRAMYAAGTAPTARIALYDVSTRATSPIWTSNCRRMSGSASVTTDESASAVATASSSRMRRARSLTPVSCRRSVGPDGAREVAVPPGRLEMLHDVAGVRRVDELAAADVDADVVVVRVEEHEVARRELALARCACRSSTARR